MIEFKNLSGVRLSESEWNSLMKGVMPVYNQLKKQHGEITLDLIFQVNKVENAGNNKIKLSNFERKWKQRIIINPNLLSNTLI